MDKIKSLAQLIKLVKGYKHQGKKIGLVTGCFDILHAGHVELLRFAKNHSDILVVGLENDATIKLSKGEGRPIHQLAQRLQVISELQSVDYVFKIPIVITFGLSEEIKNKYVKMTMKIKPDYLFTTKTSDKYINNKQTGAKELGAKLLIFHTQTSVSTSVIAEKLKTEV